MNRAILFLLVLPVACAPELREPTEVRTTINELLLEDARRCDSGFEYPQSLIDGIGTQLVEELQCLDDTWLIFYEPCREVGCVWADGPQPHAMRPEVYDALVEAATSIDDFISITAAYRDVGMQYYSRWYNENCDASFDAAIPGQSNHQGGRAVDVRFWDFWWDTLLDHGFEHPIVTDNPHFELRGTAAFRAESEELKVLSVLAFQRLWNRNNPGDPIAEDGVYGDETKRRLGRSPVEGFPIGACPPGSGGADPDPEVGVEPVPDVGPTPDADLDVDPTDVGVDAPVSDSAEADTSTADVDSGTADTPRVDAADASIDTGPVDASREDGGLMDAGSGTESLPPPLFSIAGEDVAVTTRGCSTAGKRGSAPLLSLLGLLAMARTRRRAT